MAVNMGREDWRSQRQPGHICGGLLMVYSPPKHPCLHRLLCIKAARSSTETAGLELNILNVVFSLIMRTVTHPLIISLYIKREKTSFRHVFNGSCGIHFVYFP